jgi:hypothetical protein
MMKTSTVMRKRRLQLVQARPHRAELRALHDQTDSAVAVVAAAAGPVAELRRLAETASLTDF